MSTSTTRAPDPLLRIVYIAPILDFCCDTLMEALHLRRINKHFDEAFTYYCAPLYRRICAGMCAVQQTDASRRNARVFQRIVRSQPRTAFETTAAGEPNSRPSAALARKLAEQKKAQDLLWLVANMCSSRVGGDTPFLRAWSNRGQIISAVTLNGSADCLDLLLSKSRGSELVKETETDSSLVPLIMTAVRAGSVPCIDVCLKYGADINAAGSMTNALLLACQETRLGSMVPALLERGADPNHRSMAGRSALQTAISYGKSAIAVRALLRSGKESPEGIFVSSVGPYDEGHSPLTLALSLPLTNEEVVDELLQLCDINRPNGNGETPLQVAVRCQRSNPRLVERLVRYGADVNKPGGGSYSCPVACAIAMNSPNVLKVLLDAGASTTLPATDGANALSLCRHYRSFECETLINSYEKARS